MRILVLAEDADRLCFALSKDGCEVVVKSRAAEAEHLLLCERFDAVVFHPPCADAYFLGRMLREHPARTLIAWLRSSSSDRVTELLEAGADEILDGTMSDRELMARVRNATRHGRRSANRMIELGDLEIVAPSGRASWHGRPLALTRRERGVLLALAESAGEAVAREVIYGKVWGYSMVRGDRSVDVYVKRLRDKLVQAGVELAIRTAPGVGYRLALPDAEAGKRNEIAAAL
jgi:DNA-binding response OmpR family regulator